MYNSIEQLLMERNLANLQASSFTKQMLSDYNESSIHILIYAVQNQHNLPSASSIRKYNRRQQRRQLNKQTGKGKRAVQRKMVNTPRRRYNIKNNSNRNNRPYIPMRTSFMPAIPIPPNFSFGQPGFPSNLLQLGLPGVTANSIPPLSYMQPLIPQNLVISTNPNMYPWMANPNANFPLPLGHPLSFPSIPPGFTQTINQRQRKRVIKQAVQKHPLSEKFIYTLGNRPPKKMQMDDSRAVAANPETKQKQKKYQLLSPEMITLKALRKKCEDALRPQILQIEAEKSKQNTQKVEKKQVPLYFQKKKESQKRRRQQKHELIKKNRKALFKIFGRRIFQKGWFISRKQILQALNYNQPSSCQSQQIQGIDDLFAANSQEKPKLEKEEVMDSISQIFMIETASEILVTPCISG